MDEFDYKSSSSESEPTWRICYSSENIEGEDKLVCPWECKGTIQYVHSSCIEQWAKIASNNSYDSLESLKCELCHSIFQKRRQLLSLRMIIKNIVVNFKDHLKSHCESIFILAYIVFLAYRSIKDAKLRYIPYKKQFGKVFAASFVFTYTSIIYFQIGCLLKREIRKLIKFIYIFKDSMFSYKFCDNSHASK